MRRVPEEAVLRTEYLFRTVEACFAHRILLMKRVAYRRACFWHRVSQAQSFLVNPVEERIFCDNLLSDDKFPVCGINALAHYTWLNPDSERMIMVPVKQLREFKSSGVLVRPNEFDGNIIIEAWKYPPVTAIGTKAEWVDRLSLAISLREDEDPRVEGEVERLINETEWKD